MRTASIIKENTGNVYNVDKDTYEDIDLTQFNDEELMALGIDPSSVEREEEDEEDIDEEQESLEDDEEESTEEDNEDSEDDEETESDKEEQEKDIRIPKARFDEAVQKERAKAESLEKQILAQQDQINKLLELQLSRDTEKTQEQVEKTQENVDELEAQYAEALLQGETADAVKIRTKINKINQDMINKLVEEARQTAKAEAKTLSEDEKFNIVVSTSTAKYPQLDNNSEDFDEDLVDEINALAAGYQQTKKLSADKALQKAIDKLIKPVKEDVKENKTPISDKKKSDKTKKVAKEPPRAPATKIKDLSEDEIDWENMSEKEFDTLYKKNPEMVSNYLNGIHLVD